jgi:DNA end-binding protein Ku
VARRAVEADVLELAALCDAAEHQTATAHVAATGERRGKAEPSAENLAKDAGILRCSYAAEQNGLTIVSDSRRQPLGVADEWTPVALLLEIDRHPGELSETSGGDTLFDRPEPPARGDDQRALDPVGRTREGARIGELAAKVEAAQERKDVAERCALWAAELDGERKRSAPGKHHAGTFALTVGRREQKNSLHMPAQRNEPRVRRKDATNGAPWGFIPWTMPARAIASATVSFGLVSIPVKLYPATEPGAAIRFHWLHKKCGTRLKQQYFCPKDEQVVSRKDMVKGYEFSKNRYVEFTPEELRSFEERSTQTIEITEFVPVEEIDPIYFEHSYYLGPEKGGRRPFALLAKAMAETERVALGKYAARGKQYLVLVRRFRQGLVMQQLYYADEIRKPIEAELDGKVKQAEVELAKRVIEQISSDKFKPEGYEDEVRARVRAQIRRKVEGKEITEEEPRRAKVIDLMEALKASIAEGREPRKRAASSDRRPAKRARSANAASRKRRARRSSTG